MIEKIVAASGVALAVEKFLKDDGSVEVTIHIENHKQCLLHWGMRQSNQPHWQIPPRSVWPEGTRVYDKLAVQTPFTEQNGRGLITIELDRTMDFASLDFALFFPENDRWDNNNG
jgi:alpha-glucan, water dikinase